MISPSIILVHLILVSFFRVPMFLITMICGSIGVFCLDQLLLAKENTTEWLKGHAKKIICAHPEPFY